MFETGELHILCAETIKLFNAIAGRGMEMKIKKKKTRKRIQI